MAWEISIPSSFHRGVFDGLETYDTKEEALAVARREWGADENGMVSIINELPDDGDDDEDSVLEADKAGEFDMIDFASKVCGA